jgi:hypothetical protein
MNIDKYVSEMSMSAENGGENCILLAWGNVWRDAPKKFETE